MSRRKAIIVFLIAGVGMTLLHFILFFSPYNSFFRRYPRVYQAGGFRERWECYRAHSRVGELIQGHSDCNRDEECQWVRTHLPGLPLEAVVNPAQFRGAVQSLLNTCGKPSLVASGGLGEGVPKCIQRRCGSIASSEPLRFVDCSDTLSEEEKGTIRVLCPVPLASSLTGSSLTQGEPAPH